MRENFWVYLATNKTHTVLYCGVTNNLGLRMWQHKNRTNPKSFTSRYSVNRLVWSECFPTALEAISCEKRIKGLTRAKKDAIVCEENPRWNDLSADWDN
ncbi:MAG: GIY-YIG nuclease family protein [Chthoniobacter sp.]|uniref:GIY-YIG nuclease family protein n=1 Tax=Chthoniobacter sp. TaxID=2510640 RepID=UPI0032A72E38